MNDVVEFTVQIQRAVSLFACLNRVSNFMISFARRAHWNIILGEK